jgi:hypothetical protein
MAKKIAGWGEQIPKRSPLEIVKALRNLMYTNIVSGEGFSVADLDHNSPRYVKVEDGGVSNKEIKIAGCSLLRDPKASYPEALKAVMGLVLNH